MLIELTKVLWILKYAMKFYKKSTESSEFHVLWNLLQTTILSILYHILMITIWRMFRRFASGVLPWKGLFSGIKDVPSKLRRPCWHCNAHTQRASKSPCYKVLRWAFVLIIIWGWFGWVGLFKPRPFQMSAEYNGASVSWKAEICLTFYNNFSQF